MNDRFHTHVFIEPSEHADQRVNNRIREHGNDFQLLRGPVFHTWLNNEAICVRSLRDAWWGWFSTDQIEWKLS